MEARMLYDEHALVLEKTKNDEIDGSMIVCFVVCFVEAFPLERGFTNFFGAT